MNSANKNLRKLKTAEENLTHALTALAEDDNAQNRAAVEAAKQKLQIALARNCHDMAIKAAYKAASESAKIEFRGNQRYMATSYTGTALPLGAGMLSILVPFLGLGAVAAPLTGLNKYVPFLTKSRCRWRPIFRKFQGHLPDPWLLYPTP